MKIKILPYSSDNYAYLCLIESKKKSSILVDAGSPDLISQLEKYKEYPLMAIFITHSHSDHINGLKEIMLKHPSAKIYGHPNFISNLRQGNAVSEGENISVDGVTFEVYECAAHHKDHLIFKSDKDIFVGDVIFSGGCGKFFDGNAEDFFLFSEKLLKMTESCKLYFGHENTKDNLLFAASIEPDNHDITEYLNKISECSEPNTPTTLDLEKKVNPFLRYRCTSIKAFAANSNIDPNDVRKIIETLRNLKNNF